jgi:hypothetical protein
MPSLWSDRDRESINARLDKLRPDMKPRWGRMNASQMLAHLGDSMRMALGEMSVTRRNFHFGIPLRYPPLKQMVVYGLLAGIPFPKGAPAAPEIIARSAEDWEAEREALRALVQRAQATPEDYQWAEHFIFGPFSRDVWGKLGYKHFDHHLRQFGV